MALKVNSRTRADKVRVRDEGEGCEEEVSYAAGDHGGVGQKNLFSRHHRQLEQPAVRHGRGHCHPPHPVHWRREECEDTLALAGVPYTATVVRDGVIVPTMEETAQPE